MYGKNTIISQFNGIPWWLMLIQGLAAILFGFYSFINPTLTLMFFVMVMGAYVLVEGLALFVAVFKSATGHLKPGFVFLRALIGVIGGLFVLFNPLAATVATSLFMGIIIGFVAISNGIFDIACGFDVRKGTNNDWAAVISGTLYLLVGMFFIATPLLSAAAIGVWAGIVALILGSFYVYSAIKYKRHLDSLR